MNPLGKINVFFVVTGHFNTFGYKSRLKPKVIDWILFVLFPILLGVTYAAFRTARIVCGIPGECWDTAVTITSIFTPLTLSLLTSLYGMKEKLDPNLRAIALLREIAYNICYTIIIAIALLVVALIVKSTGSEKSIVGSTLFIILSTHLFLTLIMVIKRFIVLFVEAVDGQ